MLLHLYCYFQEYYVFSKAFSLLLRSYIYMLYINNTFWKNSNTVKIVVVKCATYNFIPTHFLHSDVNTASP
jgi:hypothetical protein